jgi:hypothetical protein
MGLLVFSTTPPGKAFLRGDSNGDGVVDLSDAVHGLLVLFAGLPAGDCPAARDANADSRLDVGDAVFTLDFLFRTGPPPPAPWPACGEGASSLPCTRSCG